MELSRLRAFLAGKPGVDAALKAVIWVVIAGGVYQVLANPYSTQWDFKLYVTCSKAQSMGLNPYDDMLTRQTLGYHWAMPCLYPPAVISAYKPFSAMATETFHRGSFKIQAPWALLKLAMIAGLLALWRRYLELKHEVPLLLFLLLAYGNPIYIDLRSGNIAVLEQLLLWAGFAFLLSGRDAAFAACVILAAQPKLVMAGFLLLLLLRPRPRWGAFAAACAAFAGVFSLNYAFHPALTSAYFEKLVATSDVWANEAGTINSSTSAFARDLLAAFGVKLSDAARPWLMLAINGVIIGASARACAARLRRGGESQRLELALFCCVAYALLVPRLKDYSYLVMLPPTLYILGKAASPRWRAAIVACVCLNSMKGLGLRLGLGPAAALFAYFKWYAIVLIWWRYARLFDAGAAADAAASRPVPTLA